MKKVGLLFLLTTLLTGCSQWFEKEEEVIEEPIEVEEVVEEENDNIVILVNTLNVRKEYTTSSDVVGQVHLDEVYEVLDTVYDQDNKTWYQIEMEGVFGYVAGWYAAIESNYREEMRLAYLGTLDGRSIGESIVDLKETLGEPTTMDSIGGSMYYVYTKTTYFSDSSLLDEGSVLMISYTGSKSLYGIRVGMTIDEITEKIGEFDETLDFRGDTANDLYADSYLYIYHTGDHNVILRFEDPEGRLKAIVLE